MAENIKVVARFRPINGREKKEAVEQNQDPDAMCVVFLDEMTCSMMDPIRGDQKFNFDRIFPTSCKQTDVYDVSGKAAVENILQGYNGTIFAYGQTGSGKSFTMFGSDIHNEADKGIIPRASEAIFKHIAEDKVSTEYTIKVSFLEIYMESITDLLNPKNKNLPVRESPTLGIYVDGCTREFVGSESDIMDLLTIGENSRSVSFTEMNAVSSRSHSIFVVELHQKSEEGSTKQAKLNLVDLAGSEKVGKTNVKGQRLKEAAQINGSLSALGSCINALTKAKRGHIPYRDSKLTRMLQESLGGNCKTTLFIACSPHPFNREETISTLKFGQRAKSIKNEVKRNAQKSVAELMAIIKHLKAEIGKLRAYCMNLEQQIEWMKSDEYTGDPLNAICPVPRMQKPVFAQAPGDDDEDDPPEFTEAGIAAMAAGKSADSANPRPLAEGEDEENRANDEAYDKSGRFIDPSAMLEDNIVGVAELQVENDNLKKKNSFLEEDRAQLEEENNKLHEDLAKFQENGGGYGDVDVDAMEQEIRDEVTEEYEEIILETEKEKDRLQEELDAIKEVLGLGIADDVEAIREKVNDLTSGEEIVDALETALTECQDELEEEKKQLEEMEREATKAKEKLKHQEIAVENLKATIKELEQNAKDQESQHKEFEEELEAIMSELETVQEQKNTLENMKQLDSDDANNLVMEMEQQMIELEKEKELLETKHESSSSELKKAKENLEAIMELQEEAIKFAEEEGEKATEANDKLEQAQLKISELELQVEELKRKVNELKALVKEANKNAKGEEEVSKLREKLNLLELEHRKVVAQEKEAKHAESRVKILEEQVLKDKEKYSALLKEKGDIQEMYDEMAKKTQEDREQMREKMSQAFANRKARVWRPVAGTSSILSAYQAKEDFGQHILRKTKGGIDIYK